MADVAAACCAQFYELDYVQLFLGDSFHPGGLPLSRRLVSGLELPLGARVLDVACGTGTTAVMVAKDLGARVTGLDFSEKNITRARERATKQRVMDQMDFISGAADALPYEDGTFHAVVCECAVSTFVDKAAAAQQFARVLAPGGMLCVSDMAAERALPSDLVERAGRWTCVADALSGAGYVELFAAAGLTLVEHVDERDALLRLVSDLKRKLLLAGVGQLTGTLPGMNLDLMEIKNLLNDAKAVVDSGALTYGRWVFSKGAPRYFQPVAVAS